MDVYFDTNGNGLFDPGVDNRIRTVASDCQRQLRASRAAGRHLFRRRHRPGRRGLRLHLVNGPNDGVDDNSQDRPLHGRPHRRRPQQRHRRLRLPRRHHYRTAVDQRHGLRRRQRQRDLPARNGSAGAERRRPSLPRRQRPAGAGRDHDFGGERDLLLRRPASRRLRRERWIRLRPRRRLPADHPDDHRRRAVRDPPAVRQLHRQRLRLLRRRYHDHAGDVVVLRGGRRWKYRHRALGDGD